MKNKTIPVTAAPLMLNTKILIAGHTIDIADVEGNFRKRVAYYRHDVRDYIEKAHTKIPGLNDLESAIRKKHPENVKLYMTYVVDEIIDKVVDKNLLSFARVPIPEEFESKVIENAANRYADYFGEIGK